MQYLIDASVYVFRAYYSMPDDMVDAEGNPVNALYGFCRFLGDFIEQVDPEHIAVLWDESLATSFRNDIYPPYKANREPAPPELERQFAQCKTYTQALGIVSHGHPRFEADDLIGTLVERGRAAGMPSTIISRDKDLAQLVDRNDVCPEQIADFLALAGDAVDNIPGVPGVGKKTAAALLDHFDDLDVIYDNLHRIHEVKVRGAGSLAAKLEKHRDAAFIARQLTSIARDVPIEEDVGGLLRKRPDLGAVNALFDKANIGTALRRQAERLGDMV